VVQNEDVELVDVSETGGFKNWDKYQNQYMKVPDSIQNYHIFQVNSSNPNRLMCQKAKGYPIIFPPTRGNGGRANPLPMVL
jgi:hypothetical protein